MLDTLRDLLAHQYDAAFGMLGKCIDQCPEPAWHAPVANLAFCQVAFHTLFFADYYLGENEHALRKQQFHQDHQDFFRDYEELVDRAQKLLYERSDISAYLTHCRDKASEVVARESAAVLSARCEFARRDFSRAELHIVNVRHIQHHTAQLSLRLRLDHGQDVAWVGSGWPI